MKKLTLTIAIVLGIALGASAQNGGLFGKGPNRNMDNEYSTRGGAEGSMFNLSNAHGSDQDVSAPLGGGALLLIGFGAAYALKKRKKSAKSNQKQVVLADFYFNI